MVLPACAAMSVSALLLRIRKPSLPRREEISLFLDPKNLNRQSMMRKEHITNDTYIFPYPRIRHESGVAGAVQKKKQNPIAEQLL